MIFASAVWMVINVRSPKRRTNSLVESDALSWQGEGQAMKRSVYASQAASILAVLLLPALPMRARAADSITNFGVVQMPLGQAIVDQDGNTIVNITTNRGDGVSIFVGEADSGIFVTPNVSGLE